MTLLQISVAVMDSKANVPAEAKASLAEIVAIRVGDTARHIYYAWDAPARAWNDTPEVTEGANMLIVDFYAENRQVTAQGIILTLKSARTQAVIKTVTVNAEPGQRVGLNWIGDCNADNSSLLVKAEYSALVYVPPEGAPAVPTPGPAPTLPPVGIPELPTYLSWLTPLLEYVAKFGEAVVNYMVQTLGGWVNAAEVIASLGTNIQGAANNVVKTIQGAANEVVLSVEPSQHGWIGQYKDLLDATAIVPPGTALEDRVNFAGDWLDRVMSLDVDIETKNQLMQTTTLGLERYIEDWRGVMEGLFHTDAEAAKIYSMGIAKGLTKSVEYHWNSVYTPELPGEGELIDMAAKGLISSTEYANYMKFQGVSTVWSARLLQASKRLPSLGEVFQAYHRAGWTDDKLYEVAMRLNYSERELYEVWSALIYELPGYGEITNMRVKEIITQADYRKYLSQLGYRQEWADKIWDAHFAPAAWNDFLTAMRRKQTVSIPHAEGGATTHTFGVSESADFDVLRELSVLVDYDARYWDFFRQRIYSDPTPRFSMWAYDEGVIPEATLREIVHRYGYTPDVEKWYGDMLVHFQERPWVTRYLQVLSTAFVKDVIDADTLKRLVKEIPRNEAVADWIIRISVLRKTILASKAKAVKEKLLSVADIKKLTAENYMTEDVCRTELLQRGYSTEDVEYLMKLIQLEKSAVEEGRRVAALTVNEWLMAWRYAVVTEDALRVELGVRGLPQDQINTLIETKKKQWSMEGG
jgi:hypothetical protein